MESKNCKEINKKNKLLKDLSVLEIEDAIRPYYADFYSSLQQSIANETSLSSMAANYYNKLHADEKTNQLDMIKIVDPNDAFACITAFNTMMTQAISVVLGLTALPGGLARSIGRAVTKELGVESMNYLGGVLHQLNTADSLIDRATAFATLFILAVKNVSLPVFLRIAYNEMNLGEKILYGTAVTAQLTAWLATDEAALAGELVLDVIAVNNLVHDVQETLSACHI